MIGWIAIAVLAIGGVYRVIWGYPRPPQHFRALTRGEAAFISAAAEAMLVSLVQ